MAVNLPREQLAASIRTMLADLDVREVPMFGAVAFMVDGAMLVAADRAGDLLVRAEPGRHEELLREPGARQAEMGTGRSMGPGWVSVDAANLTEPGRLTWWMGVAEDFHSEVRR